MSEVWENHEPAPLEFFHALLMKKFHEFRTSGGKGDVNCLINGSDLNKMIASAKMATYAKYPKQVNQNAILKTEV